MGTWTALEEEVADWLWWAVGSLPGRAGLAARRLALGRRVKLGRGAVVGERLIVTGGERIAIADGFRVMRDCALYAHGGGRIDIGENASINSNVCLNAGDGGAITIGRDVQIAQNVVVRASNHEHRDPDATIRSQGHRGGTISIGDDVWIAANVVLLPDVAIGAHSIVAAGAVVTKDVPPYSIAAGVPARVIRDRRELKA